MNNIDSATPEALQQVATAAYSISLPASIFEQLEPIAGGPEKVESFLHRQLEKGLESYYRLAAMPENRIEFLLSKLADQVDAVNARMRHAENEIRRSVPDDLDARIAEIRELFSEQLKVTQSLAKRQSVMLDILVKLLAAPEKSWAD